MTLPRLTRTTPAPKVGIVHLGLGAFFRAHGAIFIEDAEMQSGGDWGIVGVSLQSPGMRDALAPQGGVYSAVELAPEGERCRTVQQIDRVLVAQEDPGAVLKTMADPAVRIVTTRSSAICIAGLRPSMPLRKTVPRSAFCSRPIFVCATP